jgi:hypothetical protein
MMVDIQPTKRAKFMRNNLLEVFLDYESEGVPFWSPSSGLGSLSIVVKNSQTDSVSYFNL